MNNIDIMKNINNKKNKIDNIVKTKTKQLEKEVNKKHKDEDKIELMTQFMLDPTSSATKLLEKRREMYELQEALQRDKGKYVEKEDQFKKTEEELRNRDEEFHKKIIEYYKNSFEKKQTDNFNYTQKLEDEKAKQKSLESSIGNLEKNNEKLRIDLDKLKKIHDSLRKYEEFLKNVKEKYPENFKDINDIISSYRTLKDTYENIKEEESAARKKKDDEKLSFQRMKKEYDSKVNNIITSISTTQQELKVNFILFYFIYILILVAKR
jgi:hypothetical protein